MARAESRSAGAVMAAGLLALLSGYGSARAAAAPSAITPAVPLQDTTYFDLTSKSNGRAYRVFVYRPRTPAPTGGYPLLVLTDGNGAFPIGAGAGALNTLVERAVLVVGVGYPTDDPILPLKLRNRDLTAPTPIEAIRTTFHQPAAKAQDWGGSEAFYHFIVDELRPALAARYPVDPKRQTLYGHSLGGLFVLGVMFRHPQAFSRYVASSPSIALNDRAVLKDEAGFAAAIRSGTTAPRIWVTIGAQEQTLPKGEWPAATRAELERSIASARMVDNARELGARLAALPGAAGYSAQFEAFADEDHVSVMPASISRAVRFASEP